MNTHVVVKGFEGSGGVRYQPGQEVDASMWRNTPGLVRGRYLRPIEGAVPLEPSDTEAVIADLRAKVDRLMTAVFSSDPPVDEPEPVEEPTPETPPTEVRQRRRKAGE